MADKNSTVKDYAKELRRIKRFIREAEKRGFRFEKDVVPDKPKRITEASVRRLKKITPKELYKKATALSGEGKVISGTERRAEERRESARKGVETRRKRYEEASKTDETFERTRREQDRQETERLRMEEEYRNKFEQGRIVYNRLLELVEQAKIDNPKSANHVQEILKEEIDRYGFDNVMLSISQAQTEIIEICEMALYYRAGSPQHDTAIRELINVIRGTIPTAEEAQELQNLLEQDDYM